MKLLEEKPSELLIEVSKMEKKLSKEQPYAGSLAKRIDTTSAHAVKLTAALESRGLIEKEKKGRKKLVHLTDKGRKVAEHLREVKEELQNLQNTNEVAA